MTTRIAMWSGPRNISTAMMRSWENRADTSVVDEPFYAYYLDQTQSPHPYFNEVVSSQPTDYQEVVNLLTTKTCSSRYQYQKHMTHHMLEDVDLNWTSSLQHCFLIRDPEQVVNSYTNSRGECCAQDIGIIRQAQLYEEISEITGQDIPIIDSNDVLSDPANILSQLCDRLDLPFTSSMLAWPKGPRGSDGVWASHWYHSVEQSTGFGEVPQQKFTLTQSQRQVVEEVRPYFSMLSKMRIKPAQ